MVGWPVYALQTYLNSVFLSKLAADGAFGPQTETTVEAYQATVGLVADGIVGPATQSRLVMNRARRVEAVMPTLPDGLLKGALISEGGLMLAPVNWGVDGGVDCGAAQYRVFGPPFAMDHAIEGASLKDAFGPVCVRKAAEDFLDRREGFLAKGSWSKGNVERAGRLAAFAHNWPVEGGASYYADHGHVQNPTGDCSWLPRDRDGNLIVRFPDGVLVRSRQDWAEFYAMGGVHGEGVVTRFVTDWS